MILAAAAREAPVYLQFTFCNRIFKFYLPATEIPEPWEKWTISANTVEMKILIVRQVFRYIFKIVRIIKNVSTCSMSLL